MAGDAAKQVVLFMRAGIPDSLAQRTPLLWGEGLEPIWFCFGCWYAHFDFRLFVVKSDSLAEGANSVPRMLGFTRQGSGLRGGWGMLDAAFPSALLKVELGHAYKEIAPSADPVLDDWLPFRL